MTGKVIVHAPSIHSGGGKVLLTALLKCTTVGRKCIFHINDNMKINLHSDTKHELKFFRSSLFARVLSEISLLKLSRKEDLVICFGNLPPLLCPKGQIFIFVQNKFVIDNSSLRLFPFRVRLSIQIQRIIFKLFLKSSYHLVVQSQTMYELIRTNLSSTSQERIHLLPLVPLDVIPKKIDIAKDIDININNNKFIYIASGEAHKNHLRLLRAWELLAKDGLYPKLLLTLNGKKDLELLSEISKMRVRFPIKIQNLGVIDHEQVLAAYHSADVLIFPSLTESFGLPLIEANNANLPIIASELDFVRDLVTPTQTFDPYSVSSIARAVKRHLGIRSYRSHLLAPQEFFEKIIAISDH